MLAINIIAKPIKPHALIKAVPAFLTKNKDKISTLVNNLTTI